MPNQSRDWTFWLLFLLVHKFNTVLDWQNFVSCLGFARTRMWQSWKQHATPGDFSCFIGLFFILPSCSRSFQNWWQVLCQNQRKDQNFNVWLWLTLIYSPTPTTQCNQYIIWLLIYILIQISKKHTQLSPWAVWQQENMPFCLPSRTFHGMPPQYDENHCLNLPFWTFCTVNSKKFSFSSVNLSGVLAVKATNRPTRLPKPNLQKKQFHLLQVICIWCVCSSMHPTAAIHVQKMWM